MRLFKEKGLQIAEVVIDIVKMLTEYEEASKDIEIEVGVIPYNHPEAPLRICGLTLTQLKKNPGKGHRLQNIHIASTAYEYFVVYTDYPGSKKTKKQLDENMGYNERMTFDSEEDLMNAARYVVQKLIEFADG